MPVILASMLIPKIAEKLIWVCPRDALKYQGEEEFIDPRWNTDKRLRATNGNNVNPDRGTNGYITTFQAIGTRPEEHYNYVRKHDTLLFLDEAQFIGEGQAWAQSLDPIVKECPIVTYASGTIARGDGNKIAFLDYENGEVVLENTENSRSIIYGRRLAIQEKSILPVHGRTIDGAAEWISEEGIHRKIDSIVDSGSDRSAAIFTAVRTEYAYQLLEATIKDWEEMRKTYPPAKLLVVAPNIEYAKLYHQYLARHYLAEIATSEDSPAARRTIADFKRGVFPVLVTVAMAFVGLSVKSITHIACLTQVRSVPWLEQTFARANRVDEGKPHGVVYGPADYLFLQAMRMIENEERPGLKEDEERRTPSANPVELVESVAAPKIEPLWSTAHGVADVQPMPIAQSEMERVLLDNIRAIKRAVLTQKRPGAIQTAEKVMNMRIRLVADKKLEDMSIEELAAVWDMMRKNYA